MKKTGRSIGALLLILASAALANQASAADSSLTPAGGILSLYKNNDNNHCGQYQLPTSGAQYLGDNACKNDQVYDFNIYNPGGHAIVRLGSDKPKNNQCEAGDWTFTLLAENMTGNYRISLDSLKNVPNNTVIREGLKMLQNNYKKGNIKGKLSCVNSWADNTRSNN